MRSKDSDLTWIQTQLTLARWHLHVAASSATETVRHRVKQAWEAYETTRRFLSRLQLSEEQRASVERELSALRSRLEMACERI